MKRKNGNSSSLEMLLDTMCNTFGAVVFLCLTLVVLLSARSSLPPPPETPADETELVRLQTAYAEAAEQLAVLIHSRTLSVNASEVLKLELAQSQERVAQKKQQYEIQKLRLKEAKLRLENQAAASLCRRREMELQRLTAEETKQEAALKDLKKQEQKAESAHQLSFSRREESREEPYFLLLNAQGFLHRVGLERVAGELRPSDETVCQRQGNVFICSARPGRGRALCLADGSINPEVWQVLSALSQQGRHPSFRIAKESAAAFFKLRFELKQRNIRFNWFPLPESGSFQIVLTNDPVTWEYAQ